MGKIDDVTVAHLRGAVGMCGYDFDEVVGNHTNRRVYTDLRAVIWVIVQEETGATAKAIGDRFGWNRSTVFSSLVKARELREYDRDFRGLYDSVYGYYSYFEVKNGDKEGIEREDAGGA